jgi:sarcosine oxidase delta subunit
MKSLPLIVGCTLAANELAEQAGRAAHLRPSVATLMRSEDELRVAFEPNVDRAIVDEMVATEQGCCTFLEVEYDDSTHLLRIRANDPQGREVVGRLAEFFGEDL